MLAYDISLMCMSHFLYALLAGIQVDTHVHAASCMNQKHLLRFIKKQMKTKREEVVIVKAGEELTLKQVHMSVDVRDDWFCLRIT